MISNGGKECSKEMLIIIMMYNEKFFCISAKPRSGSRMELKSTTIMCLLYRERRVRKMKHSKVELVNMTKAE